MSVLSVLSVFRFQDGVWFFLILILGLLDMMWLIFTVKLLEELGMDQLWVFSNLPHTNLSEKLQVSSILSGMHELQKRMNSHCHECFYRRYVILQKKIIDVLCSCVCGGKKCSKFADMEIDSFPDICTSGERVYIRLKDAAQVTVDEAETADGACYLELKVPSRSRRDGILDFLDRYGYHYGDGIARPLLPSEVLIILK